MFTNNEITILIMGSPYLCPLKSLIFIYIMILLKFGTEQFYVYTNNNLWVILSWQSAEMLLLCW